MFIRVNGKSNANMPFSACADFSGTGHVLYFEKRKTARIRNQYNQVPHLCQDTKWDSNKITINNTNKSQEVCHLPLGEHKAAMNRRRSMTNTRHNRGLPVGFLLLWYSV